MSTFVSPGNGISGGYDGDNINIQRVIMSFTAIAWYNSIETIILVFLVFKRYRGIYFYSLLLTSVSVLVYSIGAWTKLISLTPAQPFFPVTFTAWGWIAMVTGQSLVLWSRLHLILQNETVLRALLCLILTNSVVMGVPTIVLIYGSNGPSAEAFIPGYQVMERLQMTVFSVQEMLISGVYLWEVRRLLLVVCEGRTRRLMWELVAINVAIIVLDVAMLSVEFVDLYQVEITLKGMVYSIKLKLEFGVLNKLVGILSRRQLAAGNASASASAALARGATRQESEVDEVVLSRLDPVVTKDTVGSVCTGTTLRDVESHSNSGKPKSANSLANEAGQPVTAADILSSDDFPDVDPDTNTLVAAQPRDLTVPALQPRSQRTSASDFYPGRLV